jgi:low affinity Fe/Cu permease
MPHNMVFGLSNYVSLAIAIVIVMVVVVVWRLRTGRR